MEAHLLAKNSFGMPRVLSDGDADYMHIVYLLLLEPGTFQSHPNMGVGIRRYRFINDDDILDTIQTNIRKQMEAYLPSIDVSTVTLSIMEDKTLGIAINTENGIYALTYNPDTNNIDVGTTYILEQL